MKIYVNVNAGHDGNGTEQMPFRHINDADRKSTRLNSSHIEESRMPSSA